MILANGEKKADLRRTKRCAIFAIVIVGVIVTFAVIVIVIVIVIVGVIVIFAVIVIVDVIIENR